MNSYKESVDCIWYKQFRRYTAMSVVGSLVALSFIACRSGSTIIDTIWTDSGQRLRDWLPLPQHDEIQCVSQTMLKCRSTLPIKIIIYHPTIIIITTTTTTTVTGPGHCTTWTTVCTLCTTKTKCLKFSKSQTGSDVSDVNDFSESSKSKTEVKVILRLVAHVPL
jgi:hypothetical protein